MAARFVATLVLARDLRHLLLRRAHYLNLNMGLQLTFAPSVAYFLERLAVGMVISLIHKAAVTGVRGTP